jgi:uncharacterized membrane protein YkvA (DUF1232 family)
MFAGWQRHIRQLKTELYAFYLAYRDPRTPWYAKVVLVIVLGYAASPIDLIPDFIPVLGYLDDLLLVPLGILLAVRLIPPDVLAECRERASNVEEPLTSPVGAALVIMLWVIGIVIVAKLAFSIAQR